MPLACSHAQPRRHFAAETGWTDKLTKGASSAYGYSKLLFDKEKRLENQSQQQEEQGMKEFVDMIFGFRCYDQFTGREFIRNCTVEKENLEAKLSGLSGQMQKWNMSESQKKEYEMAVKGLEKHIDIMSLCTDGELEIFENLGHRDQKRIRKRGDILKSDWMKTRIYFYNAFDTWEWLRILDTKGLPAPRDQEQFELMRRSAFLGVTTKQKIMNDKHRIHHKFDPRKSERGRGYEGKSPTGMRVNSKIRAGGVHRQDRNQPRWNRPKSRHPLFRGKR